MNSDEKIVVDFSADELIEELKKVSEETKNHYDELYEKQEEQLEQQKEYIEKSIELLEEQQTTFENLLDYDDLFSEMQTQTIALNEQIVQLKNINETLFYAIGFLIGFLVLYVFLKEASKRW